MQDKLIRLVSVLFFGLIIFLVFGFIGAQTGQPSVTFWLGLILFSLVIVAQFTAAMGKSSGKSQSQTVREFFSKNFNALIGGLIVFAIVLAIVLTIFAGMSA